MKLPIGDSNWQFRGSSSRRLLALLCSRGKFKTCSRLKLISADYHLFLAPKFVCCETISINSSLDAFTFRVSLIEKENCNLI